MITFTNLDLKAGPAELATFTAASDCEIIARVCLLALAGDAEYSLPLKVERSAIFYSCFGTVFTLSQAGSYAVLTAAITLAAGETLYVYGQSDNAADTSVSGEVFFYNRTQATADIVTSNMRGTDNALPAASYTPPANADIAAIKTVTDNMPANVASQATLEAVGGDVTAIKAKTDTLPDNVAAASDVPPVAEIAAALTAEHGSGSWQSPAGSGDIAVDHNYGGVDAMRITDALGVGIDAAIVRAYLADDYAAGNYVCRGETQTGSDGRWINPLYLNAGEYVITATVAGDYVTADFNVTVTAG